MNRLFVVPAAVLLALPPSVAAFAQDATQAPSPTAHDGMSRSSAMSHGGAMAHDGMGHNTMSHDGMRHDTMGHDTMGRGAMSRATPDRMSAPAQPK